MRSPAVMKYLKASAFLWTVLLVIFGSVLFGGKTLLPIDLHNMAYLPMASNFQEFKPYNHFEDDIMRFYYDYKAQAQKYLYKPYWNPYVFGGTPQYAVTYATHFSSTNWILKFGSVEHMYCVKLIIQLFIAGLGMFFLLSSLNVSFWPALLFSMAYMLNSMFVTLMLREWMTGPFSWAPWFIALFLKLLNKTNIRGFAWSSLLLALCFTDGFFQSDGTILFLMGTLGLVHIYLHPSKKQFSRVVSLGFGVFIFAFCLSAIMWIPDLEYLIQDMAKGSSRIAGIYYHKTLAQRLLSIPFLSGFLIPELLGSVRTLDLTKLVNSNLQDFTGYIGAVPLLFGIGGFFNFKKLDRRCIYFLIFVILGICIPTFTPLDRFFYFRFFVVYILGICVVGALFFEKFLIGDEYLSRSFHKIVKGAGAFYLTIFVFIAAFTVLLVSKRDWLSGLLKDKIMKMPSGAAGSRHPQWMVNRIENFLTSFTLSPNSKIWIPFVTFSIFSLAYFAFKKGLVQKRFLVAMLFLITLIDLGHFNFEWLPRNNLNQYPLFEENSVTKFLKSNGQGFRSTFNNEDDLGTQPQVLVPNLSAPFKLHTIDGFDGMRPAVVLDLVTHYSDFSKLGLLNVGYVGRPISSPLNSPDLTKVFEGEDVLIYQNTKARPRGFTFYSQNPSDLENVLENKKIEESFDTKIISSTEMEVEYLVKNSQRGFFVTSETFYPGWKATVDGVDTPILKANGVLRAVKVDAGQSSINYKFDPSSYKWGQLITCLALGLWTILMRKTFIRRRKN